MKKHLSHRLVAILLMLMLLVSISPTAFAYPNTTTPLLTATTAQQHLDAMGERVFHVYKILRSYIALPLLIVSFASCGFKILGTIFLSRPEMDMNKVIRQIGYTVLAVFVLYFLPLLMGWAIEQLESTGWQPGCILLPGGVIGK